jgi:serine/threonine protein kinase
MWPLDRADPSRIGPYRLLARLGEGGMGTVFLAEGEGRQRVALKSIRQGSAHEPGFRARFAREIETASMVRSPYIASVVDAEPGDDGQRPWVATEYVPGPSLQQLVADQGPLPVRSAGALALGLARALETVHAAGLVHRDIKPSNILITVEGPRLIDFGVARLVDASVTGGLTSTGASVGSPGYMSPEQVLGSALSPLSDVFGMGGVLVFATTGGLPFPVADAANQHALMFAVVQDAPSLARVPAELRETVAACLAKETDARPGAAALAGRLAAHAVALDDGGAGGGTGDGEPWLPARALAEVARISGRALAQGEWRPHGEAALANVPTVTAGPAPAATPPAAPSRPPGAAPATPPAPTVPSQQGRQSQPSQQGRPAVPGRDRYVRAEPLYPALQHTLHQHTSPPPAAAHPWAAPGPTLRSPEGLATALYWLFGVYLAFKVLSIALLRGFADTVAGWKAADWALWEDVDRELNDLANLYFFDLLYCTALGVVWLVWFWRVRYNAEVFAPGYHRYTSGMAVGSWFIPFAFWVIPGKIARDTWFASLHPDDRGRPHNRSTTPGLPWPGRVLLGWWWAASIAAGVALTVLLFVNAAYENAPDREANVINFDLMAALTGWSVLLHLLCIPMAALSIPVVHRLTALQQERAHGLGRRG